MSAQALIVTALFILCGLLAFVAGARVATEIAAGDGFSPAEPAKPWLFRFGNPGDPETVISPFWMRRGPDTCYALLSSGSGHVIPTFSCTRSCVLF